MKHKIIHADVLDGLRTLEDQSIQCVVTSPPYWGLRDYGVEGQIGLEKTPEEYITKMVEVFREVKRVLRDDGTLWLNIGDCYAATHKGTRGMSSIQPTNAGSRFHNSTFQLDGLKPKDLVGIPWRLAFALQADGWYLRSDIIWSKPNPMPESVTDRPTKAHEYIFLLTKKAKYFYDADAVREECKPESIDRMRYTFNPNQEGKYPSGAKQTFKQDQFCHPAGRNRRTVWEIATQPTPEAHFATFPEALVEPCIKAGTSERGCCPKCGAPWVRVVEKGEPLEGQRAACGADSTGGYSGTSHKYLKQDALGKQTYTGFNARWKEKQQNASDVKRRILEGMRERISDWHPSCSCSADVIPCTVLDPFGGSGTVAKVARDLNRSSVIIELNAEYVKIASKKLRIGEQLDTGTCQYEVIKACNMY